MSDFEQFVAQVQRSVAERQLFRPGQSILVAVSGGLDSMILLDVLARLSEAHSWRLTVAHFNHQLRGRSSDADERLVERTAKKLGVPFVSGRADVRKYAREGKLSLEMAARKLRHNFLARTAAKRRISSIALAHHADDQVELFFVRLLRGSGGEGLAGMKWQGNSPADSRIKLVRPLLDQSKSALATYAKTARVPFREDATNAQLDIQRNRIRHELLPLLRKHYQPAMERVILRQMDILGADAEFIAAAAMEWLDNKRPAIFADLPLALQRRCLQLQLLREGLVADFDLVEQLRVSPNSPVTVSQNVAVKRDKAGKVRLQAVGKTNFQGENKKVQLCGQTGEIKFENARIHWQIAPAARGIFRAPQQRVNFECFDAAKIGTDIILRHWQPGDRFQPIGMEKAAKLQDLFINQKIPRARRHELLVGTTFTGELFWVEGLRVGERFKLDKATKYQLKWRWERLC